MSRKSARASFLTRSALNSVFHITTGAGGPFSNMDSFGEGGVDMAMKMMQYMTLRMCANLSNGMFSDELIDQLLRQANEVQA